MLRPRTLLALLLLCVAIAGAVSLLLPERDTAQEWEARKSRLQQAALLAEPLIEAIQAYVSAVGHPPAALVDLMPGYLDRLPVTGLEECAAFEYRSLLQRQGSLVWYDLGSRQGAPYTGTSRYREGDPGHAILVFTLDAREQVTGALIDRLPKDREPQDFDPERWKAAGNRIGMALALAETYRLHGMPREVFEGLLGVPDGSRAVRGTPWELRIRCPTGLLNHDSFVYWPTGGYPEQLYGGVTEPVGRWVYVHT